MSDDLTTLLREAADGPVPPIDTADLRRRGQRRRWGVRALEAGSLAVVAALGLAVLPDLAPTSPTSPAVDGPSVASSPDAAPGSDTEAASDDLGPSEPDVPDSAAADDPAVDPSGRRIGEPVEVDPDEDIAPLGAWRPAEAPLDLAPLSMRDDTEIWYLEGDGGVDDLVGAEAIADRLGSRDTFDRTCAFLTEQVEAAHRDVDVAGEDPNLVAEVVTYLVLRQEEVRGGDGLTLALALGCGVADDEPAR